MSLVWGDALPSTFGTIVRTALDKGGSAEQWREAATKLNGIHLFLLHTRALGDADAVSLCNYIGKCERLAEDEEFRTKFVKAMKEPA